jgi:two-component system sensor histidine kinase RegB
LIALVWVGALAFGPIRGKRHKANTSSDPLAEWTMFLDVAALTALLAVSGAAQNPFSMLYFVPITLTTIITPRRTWQVAALAVVGFSLLLLLTMQDLGPHREHAAHAHFFKHVLGMAVALAVAGGFVTFSVHRIGRSLFESRMRLQAYSEQQQDDRFAVALGALAAGAAHELGTPLGTVQILAEELPHLGAEEREDATRTILAEVQRMKSILHGLGSSELSAEVIAQGKPWDVEEIGSELRDLGVHVGSNAAGRTTQPRSVLGQIVRELVTNALRGAEKEKVSLAVGGNNQQLWFEVTDAGAGVSVDAAARIFRPFVSERGGAGLGLFLGAVHARQLGGKLFLKSGEAGRTCFRLELPRDPPLLITDAPTHGVPQ